MSLSSRFSENNIIKEKLISTTGNNGDKRNFLKKALKNLKNIEKDRIKKNIFYSIAQNTPRLSVKLN